MQTPSHGWAPQSGVTSIAFRFCRRARRFCKVGSGFITDNGVCALKWLTQVLIVAAAAALTAIYVLSFFGDEANRDAAAQAATNTPTSTPTPIPASTAIEVPHDWDFVPPSLYSGDRFRLICSTDGRRNATSSDIDDYNTWLRGRMASRPSSSSLGDFSTHFWVLASTSAVSARSNTKTRSSDGVGEPIFWLNGHNINNVSSDAIADNYADLYDGDWDNNNTMSRCENNNVKYPGANELFWSGSTNSGGSSARPLGADSPSVVYPHPDRHPGGGPIGSTLAGPSGATRRFWALSGVFVIGAGNPRPATATPTPTVTPTATATPTATPPPAPNMLTSNLRQRSSSVAPLENKEVGLGFETGNAQHGYDLENVIIAFEAAVADPSSVRVSLWTSDSSRPFMERFVFVNPEMINAGPNTFVAPENAVTALAPSTKYFILVSLRTDAPPASLLATDSDSEQGEADFGILDDLLDRPATDAGPWTGNDVRTSSDQVLFSVVGVPRTAPSPNLDVQLKPARVLRIEPEIRDVVLEPGGEAVLQVEVYGRQNILDNGLARELRFSWRSAQTSPGSWGRLVESSEGDDNGLPDDARVIYIAPEAAGTYELVAELEDDCLGRRSDETPAAATARCAASFEITVLTRRAPSPVPETEPRNPSGAIPLAVSDDEGVQHAVFTPEDGGYTSTQRCSISAPRGAVSDLELLGVSISEIDANDSGFIDWRFEHRGVQCHVSVVDVSGDPIADYELRELAEICMPLPDEFRANLVDSDVAEIESGAVHRILSSTNRISGSIGSVLKCGRVKSLPVTVGAVLRSGALVEPTPEEEPEPVQDLPDTGGLQPNVYVLASLLLIGAVGAVAGRRMILRRRASSRNRDT